MNYETQHSFQLNQLDINDIDHMNIQNLKIT